MAAALVPYAPYLAMLLVLAVFLLFVTEWRPVEITALCGACAALALGLVGTEDVLAALGNPAPATIGAMFVLSAALTRTGALEAPVAALGRLAQQRPVLALTGFFGAATAASAVMNNTPVVMVLMPVLIALGREIGVAGSRLLIPLSYMVILGGTCTMIGTSTNLLVDGVARDLGLAPFGLFEIAPVGLALAVIGGGFLALTAPLLLPDTGPSAASVGGASRAWLAELFIPADSPLIGRRVAEVEALRRGGGRVVDLIRGDESLRRSLATTELQAGDVVVVRSRDVELMGFREGRARGVAIPGLEASQARRSQILEVLVGPGSRAVGRSLARMRWRRRYGIYPIALHREGAQVTDRLEDTQLEVGDTLLLDGASVDLARLCEEMRLTSLSAPMPRALRRDRAPIAVATLAAVVLLAAAGVAPILTLALIGVAIVLATGCIDGEEGLAAVDGRLLLLVVSMLVIGASLERTGALALIVEWLSPVFAALPPLAALALVYAVTSILTEMVTNNAVAVLMAPLAAAIAATLGLDPRPFVVAVMFGASASFATPIGYQTNTLVHTAGGYRFVDFLRIGVPMNLICGAVTVLLIPLIWPLQP